jgi:hypothetical protein
MSGVLPQVVADYLDSPAGSDLQGLRDQCHLRSAASRFAIGLSYRVRTCYLD